MNGTFLSIFLFQFGLHLVFVVGRSSASVPMAASIPTYLVFAGINDRKLVEDSEDNRFTYAADPALAGAIVGVVFCSCLMAAYVYYISNRKTVVVRGLPDGFGSAKLLSSLEGAANVAISLSDPTMAWVQFETHADAAAAIASADASTSSSSSTWLFQGHRLTLCWASPEFMESSRRHYHVRPPDDDELSSSTTERLLL